MIGGFALPVYGLARQTNDVDCLVTQTDEPGLAGILADLGCEAIQRTSAFVRYRHPDLVLMDVDIMLVDRETFEKMYQKSGVHQVGETEWRIPSVAHLIALKLHAIKNHPQREPKDLADIVALLTENTGIVTGEELRQLCERYGPAGMYRKLEDYL